MVINEKNKEIVLFSIDNMLVASRQGGITDGALFDIEQFHFIEFKTNALGNSEQAVFDTFDKAVGQIRETIKVLMFLGVKHWVLWVSRAAVRVLWAGRSCD